MRTALALSTLFLLAGDSPATAKPPSLESLFPPGGRRGETVAVTATGSFGHWPVKTWTEGPGIEVSALPEKGKLSIAVASDARVGVHWLRLHDEEGATGLKPFLVGTLPEVIEAEPNNDPTRPQKIGHPPVTINGKLDRRGDVDSYAVPLRKGQTLVAALEANRRLGSPMDGLLQVVAEGGFELARNDDAPDLDPRIVFEAPADGTYLVRAFALPAVPDSRIGFSGGDMFIYRLTLTTGGFLDQVYPLAVTRSATGRVEAVGWNIPESARSIEVAAVDVAEEADEEEVEEEEETRTVDHPLLAGAGEVRIEPHPASVEVEPNPPEHPQEVIVPATVSGRIDPPGDRDVFRFSARKGEKWRVRVESRSLGHPLDAVLRVLDDSGKVLNEVDDPGRRRSTTRDPELTFTAPGDGAYRVVVRDLNGEGSVLHAYLLTVAPPTPGFTLTMASDRFTITPGSPLKIPLTVARDDEFRGTVEVEAVGLPGNVVAPRVSSSPSGPSAKAVTLELTASPGSWSGPFRIIGQVKEGDARPRPARSPVAGLNASTDLVWLTILPSAPSAKGAPGEKSEKPDQ